MPLVIAPALDVSLKQRDELAVMAGSSSLPHRQVVQAKGLLLAADGVANEEIARRCQRRRTRCGGGVDASPSRVSAVSVVSLQVVAGSRGCRRARSPRWCMTRCTLNPRTASSNGRCTVPA